MLESGSRVDRALKSAIAEMYLQGVSTRRVTKVMEQLCGLEVSSTQVSRLTAELDETFILWRERPLPEVAHLIVDATYIKVRVDGSVRDCAVLTAIGVRREDGKRMILGVSAKLSEAEPHWRDFLVSLKERGIGIPDSLTSDAHEGLRAALKAVFNASPWQRCQAHLQSNAQAYVPKVDMRETVAADIRTIFNADSLSLAEERLRVLVEKYAKSAPRLSEWMQTAIPEGLTVFALPEHKRRRLRTSNMSETLNTQIKRRTKVAGLFPNTDSILRLVTAILMEISEEWETGKAYLSPKK
jgi:transposase-like protein